MMAKKEFTATEVMVLQEDMNHKLDIIVEQFSSMNEKMNKIDKIEEDIEILKEDMKIVKLSLTQKADISRVDNHEVRISKLEKVLN